MGFLVAKNTINSWLTDPASYHHEIEVLSTLNVGRIWLRVLWLTLPESQWDFYGS